MTKKAIKKNFPFFIIILIIAFFVSLFLAKSYSRKNNILNIKESCRITAGKVNSIIYKNIDAIKRLSSLPVIQNFLKKPNSDSLKKINTILNTSQEILNAEMLYIMDTKGYVIASTEYLGVSFYGKNYSFRPYFKEAIKGKHISQYAALGITSKRRGIYISNPVLDKGVPIGVFVIKQGVESIEALLKELKGIYAIESPDKIIFCSNKKDLLYTYINSIPEAKIQDLKQFDDIKIKKAKLDGLDNKNKNMFWKEEIPLLLPGWKLLSIISIPKKFNLKSDELIIIFFIFLLIMTFGFIVLFLLTKLSKKIIFHNKLSEKAKTLEEINILQSQKLIDTNKELINEINHHKQTDENLKDAEERFHEVSEMIPEMVYEATLDGHILYANQSGINKFGYSPSDVPSLTVFDILKEKDLIRSNIKKYLTGEKIGIHEYTGIRKDGSEFPIAASSIVIMKEGKPIGLRGVVIDMTEQKNQEKERKRLLEHIKEEQKMNALGTLAGGVAHNFNNQLTIIQGFALLIKKQLEKDSPLLEDIEKIINASKSSEKLVKKLLEFSRKKKNSIEASNSDINRVLNDTLDMYSITNKGIDIIKNFSKETLTVNIDKSELEQIFLNICINAGHAMPNGGTLTVSTESVHIETNSEPLFLSSGEYACISIKDTGIGMDKETQKKIFEPFFTTKPLGLGTGLGLATSYSTIKALKGTITVKSKLGEGSCFRIFIPYTSSVSSIKEKPHNEAISKTALNIFIADDEQDICDLLKRMLSHLGHNVTAFNSGNNMLNSLENINCNIDLVITDIIMPGLFGMRLFKEIVKKCPKSKIIVMSAHEMGENMRNLSDHPNFHGFLDKPFTLNKLKAIIKNV